MTWLQQVWHVARKDVHQARWLLSGFVVLTVASTVVVIEFASHDMGSLTLLPDVLWASAVVVLASLVQNDPPVPIKAFWRNRPMSGPAIALAKVLIVIAFLVAIPSIENVILLHRYSVAPSVIARMMGVSFGWLAEFGVPCLLVAALTADFKSFVFALIALFISNFTSDLSLGYSHLRWQYPSPIWRHAASILWAVVVLMVFMRAYVSTSRYPNRRLIAFVVVFGFANSALDFPVQSVSQSESPQATGNDSAVGVASINDRQTVQATGSTIVRSRVTLVSVGNERTVDSRSTLTATFASTLDSVVQRLIATMDVVIITKPGSPGYMIHPGSISRTVTRAASEYAKQTYSTARGPDDLFSVPIAIPDSLVQIVRALPTGTTIVFTMNVQTFTPRVIATIPAAVRAEIRSADGRLRIVRAFNDTTRAWELSAVGVMGWQSLPSVFDLRLGYRDYGIECWIANDSVREADTLAFHQQTEQSVSTVLPGESVLRVPFVLRAARPGSASFKGRDDAWYRNAKILIVKWQPVASFPARITYVVP